VSEREVTCLVDQSILPSLGRKRLFVFPLTSAQLDLAKRKMLLNGSANVKHSEAMSDEIITAMSTACGASIFTLAFRRKCLRYKSSFVFFFAFSHKSTISNSHRVAKFFRFIPK